MKSFLKRILEKQAVFSGTLRILAFFARRERFDRWTQWATRLSARLNLRLNRPAMPSDVHGLGKTWKQLMPPDGQDYFTIAKETEDTVYTEIHLPCPLRGTGNVEACHKLMNYDRTLMEANGANLIVLESQSNSGKPYCRLAIRPNGLPTNDLIPAHMTGRSPEADPS